MNIPLLTEEDINTIIEAVRNAYAVKKVPVPHDIDLEELADEIWAAIFLYICRLDMQRGHWNARQRRGRKLLKVKSVDHILALLEADAIGIWWRQALWEVLSPAELCRLASPDESEAIGAVRKQVSLLLGTRFTYKGSPDSARMLLGPGSAFEWLIGKAEADDFPNHDPHCLAGIFWRHFRMAPRVARLHRQTDDGPVDYTTSPYLSFVMAVCAATGIPANRATITVAFNRRTPRRAA